MNVHKFYIYTTFFTCDKRFLRYLEAKISLYTVHVEDILKPLKCICKTLFNKKWKMLDILNFLLFPKMSMTNKDLYSSLDVFRIHQAIVFNTFEEYNYKF